MTVMCIMWEDVTGNTTMPEKSQKTCAVRRNSAALPEHGGTKPAAPPLLTTACSMLHPCETGVYEWNILF